MMTMSIIKKLSVCLFIVFTASTLYAQEQKLSYFTVSGSVGSSVMDYDLKGLNGDGKTNSGLGYGLQVGYSYYFNSHWGLSTGVGVSRYQAKGKLTGDLSDGVYYNLGMFRDDDYVPGSPQDFQLRARVGNLEERQTAYMLEIPLMIQYQTRFGETRAWGMYGGLGVKVQIPVYGKYKMRNGENTQLNVSGYYEGIPADVGAPTQPPVPQHGYGTITNPGSKLGWNNDIKLKTGVAGTAELGFLVRLDEGCDLMLGGYIDYGFNDLQKHGDRGLFTAPASYHPDANDGNIGKGIVYNGMINSDSADKLKLLSFGGKVTIRFQLNK